MTCRPHEARNAQSPLQRTPQESGWLARFLADEGGATAIEYAFLASGIALAIIATVNGLGGTLNGRYQGFSDMLS